MHIPFHFLFIRINIYKSTTQVKAFRENSVYKDQKLSKNLNDSNLAQIGLEMRSETLIFCCRDNTDTKHRLVEVGSAAQVLRILFSGSGAQHEPNALNRIQNDSERALD